MNMLCNKVKDLGNPDIVFNNLDQRAQIQPPIALASESVWDPSVENTQEYERKSNSEKQERELHQIEMQIHEVRGNLRMIQSQRNRTIV